MIYKEKNGTRKRKQTETRGECGTLSAPPRVFPGRLSSTVFAVFSCFLFYCIPRFVWMQVREFPVSGEKASVRCILPIGRKRLFGHLGSESLPFCGSDENARRTGFTAGNFLQALLGANVRDPDCLLSAVCCLLPAEKRMGLERLLFIYASLIYFFFI